MITISQKIILNNVKKSLEWKKKLLIEKESQELIQNSIHQVPMEEGPGEMIIDPREGTMTKFLSKIRTFSQGTEAGAGTKM